MSIHTASRIQLGLVELGLGLRLRLASQASRVYLSRIAIHTATGEASRVYSIGLFTFHMKVSMHTASLETVHAHRVKTCNRPNGSQKAAFGSVLACTGHCLSALDGRSVILMPVCDDLRSVNST